MRHTRNAIPLAAAVILLALPFTAHAAAVTQGSLTELTPSDGLTREQLGALYRALTFDSFQPAACVAGEEMFTDVPASSPFCPWIEELSRRGITTGCTATQYCPGSPVSRAQMAVFVVKAAEACPTLDPTDEMVRVGGVCIDKYEASLWDAPVGGNQITGPIPCGKNGQDCSNIYARSVAGVQPRSDISWFQAQAALENSGKRLPTNAEWQMAVRGTPDTAACNVDPLAGTTATGAHSGCVSARGVFDMVGNLWEWVADWVPASTACPGWGVFSSDFMCLSGASTTLQHPGALIRGGTWNDGSNAGPFAITGTTGPSGSDLSLGFRGAR